MFGSGFKLTWLTCAFLIIFIYQGATLDLSGTVSLPEEDGTLYIYLITEVEMKTPGCGYREKEIYLPVAIESQNFCFKDIPPGVYALRIFLDTNGNGKLDRGLKGPKEPWALSMVGELRGFPRFEDIAFSLRENRHLDFNLNTTQ